MDAPERSAPGPVTMRLLAALTSPEGLTGHAAFAQDGAADTLAPGPVLAALTEQAFADIGALTDNELAGALHAAIRLENRAAYLRTAAVAEFTCRRAAQLEDSRARKIPRGCREGEHPDLELAAELRISRNRAQDLMALATDLASRLPRTFAGMADGRIDAYRATIIASNTLALTAQDAATADETLAADAHEVTPATLASRAARLAMKLDPDAARRAREEAKSTRQRVEARRELSGNASLSGRELDTAEVMAAKASLDAITARLRDAGLDGTADSIRARAYLDLLQNRNPFDRLAPLPAEPATDDDGADQPDGADRPGCDDRPDGADRPGCDDQPGEDAAPAGVPVDQCAVPTGIPVGQGDMDEDDEGGARYPAGPGTPAGGLAPLPGLVNLIVPAATLLGWGTAPGRAGSWGLTDPEDTRRIVQSAAHHPRSRWCVTVVDDSGQAIAHACARGRHPWTPEPRQPPDPPPDPEQQSARIQDLLRGLGISPAGLEPIATGACDHRHAEDRYTPSRRLKHLIRARAQACTGPGCGAQSFHADQDHVIPYPDGPTDECNLHAPCRAHHRAKQAPGWHVEQPEPGVIRWTLPNGRTHETRPTSYDA